MPYHVPPISVMPSRRTLGSNTPHRLALTACCSSSFHFEQLHSILNTSIQEHLYPSQLCTLKTFWRDITSSPTYLKPIYTLSLELSVLPPIRSITSTHNLPQKKLASTSSIRMSRPR
ncbi:hypothetical protein A2U01_0058341, partial [Trifolium medium]|nr:hypothetical protein [Trifolium medium]